MNVPPTVTTLPQAFSILGLYGGISSQEEIHEAFRRKVKSSADGRGGYALDMDDLTQAKEFLLSALASHQEAARLDQARRRAREQEQEERKQAKARKAKQKNKPKKVEPLRLGPASLSWQAKQAFKQKYFWNCELAQWYHASQREGEVETMQTALSLLESRKIELEKIRQREQEITQELSRIQARRAELEDIVQTASSLADQILAVLK
jgi:hypothetical protein